MSDRSEKKRFSVTLTTTFEESMDRLIEEGLYIDHQAIIRDALRRLFQYHGFEPFSEKIVKPGKTSP